MFAVAWALTVWSSPPGGFEGITLSASAWTERRTGEYGIAGEGGGGGGADLDSMAPAILRETTIEDGQVRLRLASTYAYYHFAHDMFITYTSRAFGIFFKSTKGIHKALWPLPLAVVDPGLVKHIGHQGQGRIKHHPTTRALPPFSDSSAPLNETNSRISPSDYQHIPLEHPYTQSLRRDMRQNSQSVKQYSSGHSASAPS
ncbi:hypothetical protein TARUN_4698 [Trichoderma arundinaceum]|uniref:Uncharacterized protein n=1 Tax=Trichoderma arundinaceum TaxID=490622 RepID=A0A395NNH8_TRIAR|nr:hypothetical protein TARUN_4698 [Trichoderma arundinaceum]